MKKYLLATTAVIAATAMATPSFAADKIKLSLGGYFAGFAAFNDDDTADTRDVAFGSDSEVHFKGKTTLDNGLVVSFGAEMELEDDGATSSTSDDIDEYYISVDGGFGKIQFGQDDGVSSKMRLATPTPFMRVGADDVEDVELLDNPGAGGGDISAQLETEIGDDDALKLIYITPRLVGFQVGVSYAPERTKNAQGLTQRNEDSGDEMLEAAINYEYEMNEVTFGAAFGFFANDGDGATDAEHFNVGASIGFSGFTFGGNYTWGDALEVSGASYDPGSDEATIWSLGGLYENGPWAFGLQYATGEEETAGVTGEQTSYVGGVSYEFGPSMEIGAGVLFAEEDGTLGSNEGTSIFVETGLKF